MKGDPRRTGTVVWTGDNPFTYLKCDPDDDWAAFALTFRVAESPCGRGHAAIVVEDPYNRDARERPSLCLTDNDDLARFLLRDWMPRFDMFGRAADALVSAEIISGAQFESAASPSRHEESALDPLTGRRIVLSWEGLSEPFAVLVPAAESTVAGHELFAVFRTADSVAVEVDGRRVAGAPIERAFFGTLALSAGLSLSETWIREPQ